MDKIKKNIKRIWNSRCKYLVMIACALILMSGVNLLQTSLKFLDSNGEEAEEIKSVVITSSSWESKKAGSWKVEKSADWTGVKKATIKFDVETMGKNGGQAKDVVLVLDYSLSMKGDKIKRVKEDATELVEFLLTETDNQVALITFNGSAAIQSEFTKDKNQVINAINATDLAYGTNYTKALEKVDNLLSNYQQEEDRNLVVLFLTDGHPVGGNGVVQYSLLKDYYPYIIINGIQYELGSGIIEALKRVSDKQYIASQVNLRDVFFESIGVEAYETFEIVDYISDEFYVNHVNDIRVSRGTVKLETVDNGKQKVIWTIPTRDVKFITSFGATMEIDVTFKGNISAGKLYKTNDGVEVRTNLPNGKEEVEKSEKTPEIRGGYYVIYNPNLPSECNLGGEDKSVTHSYFAYENVNKFDGNYTCRGWQIKEWETEKGIPLVDDDKFVMPNHDTTVTAVWTKVEVEKKMDGTVSSPTQELLMAMKENAATVSVDTGIEFNKISSESNGRGLYIRSGTENDGNPIYYYRGNVTNNNVLFAGICWQIVRTTETGGIKLIYNGVSVDGTTCQDVERPYVGESNFYSKTDSPAYVGYMRGVNEKYEVRNFIASYWGTGATYDSTTGLYTLISARKFNLLNDIDASNYHYACAGTGTTCSQLLYAVASQGKFIVENGELPEDAIEEMFSSKYDSGVKEVIDSWYKTNIEDKGYTKYLDENTVWCNDRDHAYFDFESPGKYNNGYFASSTSRNLNNNSKTPIPAVKELVACSREGDRFTTKNASTGNKALTYPVGMLTADELILAGMSLNKATKDIYLFSYYPYWTMTPFYLGYIGTDTSNFYVKSDGALSRDLVSTSYYVRPSISLKAGTLVSASKDVDGTEQHPYVVVRK